ncbi:hypothetical protein [Helicobacter apodemus]|uniref:hypothetical protein n=1 Tax=Helicobacter apodemus TaxID=135569 RepID=UPI000AFB9127|nr:hypothetical protein [Helicobacter apodemus]
MFFMDFLLGFFVDLKRGILTPIRVQGYNALTTNTQRSIITLVICLVRFLKDKFITSFQRLKLTLEGCAPLRQTSKSIILKLSKYFKKTLFIAFLLLSLAGCASKPIVRIDTKEVFIPIKCNLTLPNKPKEDGSFQSHKELLIYYLEVESIAKDCTK